METNKVWMSVGLNLKLTNEEVEQIKNDVDNSVLNQIILKHIQKGSAVIGGDVHIPEMDIEGNVNNIPIAHKEKTNVIHLIPVNNNCDGRKFCESYQGALINNHKEFKDICDNEGIQGAKSYSLNDFMDLFNNADGDVEELDTQHYWLTYTQQ